MFYGRSRNKTKGGNTGCKFKALNLQVSHRRRTDRECLVQWLVPSQGSVETVPSFLQLNTQLPSMNLSAWPHGPVHTGGTGQALVGCCLLHATGLDAESILGLAPHLNRITPGTKLPLSTASGPARPGASQTQDARGGRWVWGKDAREDARVPT